MTDDDFTPLDPSEGPTVWAKQADDNPHTYEIVEGTDPTDSLNSYSLSAAEISRLNSLVESDQ